MSDQRIFSSGRGIRKRCTVVMQKSVYSMHAADENARAVDKVTAQKRRAVCQDITNNSFPTSVITGKKPCSEKNVKPGKAISQSQQSNKVSDTYHERVCLSVKQLAPLPAMVNNVASVGCEQRHQKLNDKKTRKSKLSSGFHETNTDCTALTQNDSVSEPMDIGNVSITSDASMSNNASFFTKTEHNEVDEEWIDVDDNLSQPHHVAVYVNDIFDYYRQREAIFTVSDYMVKQTNITASMRARLVNWLIEVQQGLELNHESLYTAVKLTDRYIDRQSRKIYQDQLQLIGAAAINIAAKFEERTPPVIDDFLYIADDVFTRDDMLWMEISILKTIDFAIGIPLSYTFLRRFAQCARVTTPTLTLARYVLETSLMDYTYVNVRESRMAAACLLLAMNMNVEGHWDGTVKHYVQYEVADLTDLVEQLNSMITKLSSQESALNATFTKYSHKVFHEVAKIAPLTKQELKFLCRHGKSGRSSVLHVNSSL